jgi:hypothetical protein
LSGHRGKNLLWYAAKNDSTVAPVSPEEIRELGARRIIESGEGLELTGTQQAQQKADKGRI